MTLTRRLDVVGGPRTGAPVGVHLLGSLFAVALASWLAAALVLLLAGPDLAAGRPLSPLPLLAVHLVALGVLPFAVMGGVFHLLPVMLRNDLRRPGRLWLGSSLSGGGVLVAPGIAFDDGPLLWAGATLLCAGLLLVLVEIAGLVRRAPSGRLLVVSRSGVALSALHVLAALALGGLVFATGDRALLGVAHSRWLLIHLHVAVLGWLTLLILAVGRTLAPMLAFAPAAASRRLPADELLLAAGLWVLLAGIALDERATALAGASLVALVLGRFAGLVVRVARARRIEPEGPLLHLLAGVLFLAQAAGLGFALLLGDVGAGHGTTAYVLLLLAGWAAGVAIGHLGKLLSLSIWVSWPPGPRPKQAALYPRRIWQAEAGAFAAGVECLALGALVGSLPVLRAGASLLVGAACLALLGAGSSWRARPRGLPPAPARSDGEGVALGP